MAKTKFFNKKRISMSKWAYVRNDIKEMKLGGTTFCPTDAHQKIKQIFDHVLVSKGGEGVMREILNRLTNERK